MLFFKLKNYNEVRIWDYLPKEFLSGKQDINICEFPSNENFLLGNKSLLLELMIARGGRIIYGALGCDYKYEDNGKICLEILTKKTNYLFENSLLGNIENIYLGLPNEYLNSVLRGIKKAYQDGRLNLKGRLRFCYAAYGEVSSCEWVFYILSYMLTSMLNFNKNNITAEILEKLLGEVMIKES
jgi:hypothetical protein